MATTEKGVHKGRPYRTMGWWQDDCKVGQNPLVVSPEPVEGSNLQQILITRSSTSSGLPGWLPERLCIR